MSIAINHLPREQDLLLPQLPAMWMCSLTMYMLVFARDGSVSVAEEMGVAAGMAAHVAVIQQSAAGCCFWERL